MSACAAGGLARRGVACAAGVALVACLAAAPAGATIVVDQRSATCSDAGPGTPDVPYCTIAAAVAAHAVAGTTIVVRPGTYREQVTVPASGTAAARIVLRGEPMPGDPVIVSGAASLTNPALWTQVQGAVWRAASVNWSPVQVFRDTTRLAAFAGDPSQLPVNAFRYVAGQGLYVNAGGGNPGADTLEAGRRAFGFLVTNRAFVTIEGFAVTRCEDRGIQVGGSQSIEVLGDSVTLCGRLGIQVSGSSAVRVTGNVVSDNADHGIAITAGSTACVIEANESCRNSFPGTRRANGINLVDAPKNLIRGNRVHDNQDTGLQFQPGADSCVSAQNASWSNGDHGIDVLRVHGTTLNSDVAWGNARDGFSIEGDAHHTTVANCIGVDNGLTAARFDLFVDDSSSVDFASNDNLFWNSTSQPPVRYRFTSYASVAAFSAASGTDTRTVQADPRFAAPAAGDFHPVQGSPVIDNANSAAPGWCARDAENVARGDDPMTPNQGLGPVPFADRGAHEYTAGGVVAVAPPEPSRRSGAPAQVTPNPIRNAGALEFSTTQPGPLTVDLYDLRGRQVRRLFESGDVPPGRHVVAIDAGSDSARLDDGIYFYRIRSDAGETSGRFIVRR